MFHRENGDQPFKGVHSDLVMAWETSAAVLIMRLSGEQRKEPRKSPGRMETHFEDCGRWTGLSLGEQFLCRCHSIFLKLTGGVGEGGSKSRSGFKLIISG